MMIISLSDVSTPVYLSMGFSTLGRMWSPLWSVNWLPLRFLDQFCSKEPLTSPLEESMSRGVLVFVLGPFALLVT